MSAKSFAPAPFPSRVHRRCAVITCAMLCHPSACIRAGWPAPLGVDFFPAFSLRSRHRFVHTSIIFGDEGQTSPLFFQLYFSDSFSSVFVVLTLVPRRSTISILYTDFRRNSPNLGAKIKLPSRPHHLPLSRYRLCRQAGSLAVDISLLYCYCKRLLCKKRRSCGALVLNRVYFFAVRISLTKSR